MISGARIGQPTWLRRLTARAASYSLTAFLVPGAEIARASGLDLAAAGLVVVPTPRYASVLVVVGELPDGLAQPAAVAYAQMARPRAIMMIGAAQVASLPAPDVTVALDQHDLVAGVADLRRRFATGAWANGADAFAIDVPEQGSAMSHSGHNHSEMHHGMHSGVAMEDHNQDDAMPMDHGGHAPMDAPADHRAHDHPDHDTADATDMDHHMMHHGTHWMADTDMPHGDHTRHGEVGRPAEHTSAPPTNDMPMLMHHGDYSKVADGDHHGMVTHDTHIDHAQGVESQPPNDLHAAMGHPTTHDDMAMPMDHGAQTEYGGHGGMDMTMDMDMSGGFMSMVAMTKDLPRSRDGLPMEWVEAPFGPLFPGLPSGLALTLTLDGDTVAKAAISSGTVHRGLAATWPGSVTTFPNRLAVLDPLAPIAYRVLAMRAIEDTDGVTVDEAVAHQRIGALERERATSHLNWLAEFALLFGDRWIATRAAELQSAVMRMTAMDDVPRVQAAVDAFVQQVRRTPLLRRRLTGIGSDTSPSAGEQMLGPFARAAGMAVDVRADDPVYRALGFTPVIHDGNDAWARLQVHLGELHQSLDLVRTVGSLALHDAPAPIARSGMGVATIETPRGPATLRLMVQEGHVHHAHLDTPSARLSHVIPPLVEGRELADALLGIASLDFSPWEMDQ